MTAPETWTRTSTDPLVVRPDRDKARSWLATIIFLNGTIAVLTLGGGLWAASSSTGAIAALPFVLTLTGCVFQMVFHAFFWGRMLGTDQLAEIGPAGIRGLTTRWERVDLPWDQVASVSGGWNRVLVTPRQGPKVSIPVRAVDRPESVVRAAIAHFSGGRL